MASFQEAEVQFAQRLASNEKPVRTKAIKKLRKYINVRSQKAAGGFTGDELLKLWKGLFYCLWMQDKPLLQEELSNQISSLIHSFHNVDAQFLYLESFLQTFKREWTGIDRLRMDKFFQVVRFMFRQTFELLKRKNWESSLVSRFLELLTAQLLQSSSDAPSGLQLHILDLYMTELAAVGSAELAADQNLIFIEPFCKTAAKTKDRTLFRAICSSIFSTIIEQAPFAIEELMKEVKAAEDSDSDSGQASEEDDEDEQLKEKTSSKPVGKKRTGMQINGKKSNEEEDDEDDDDDDDDDDELLHLEDSDTEAPCDEDVGPVLQFDYAALADKLFELASRSSTPSQNRQRLYKIIKVLRDLSEGIFPQDEYPEEVSTDEDDDMFGSRKRIKRGKGRMEEDDEGVPATKKSKGKKKEASGLSKQTEDTEGDNEPADLTAHNENKKKKKRKKKKKKKKAGQGGEEGGENAERSEQEQIVAQSTIIETEGSQKEAKTQNCVSSVKVTSSPDGQPESLLLLSEVQKQPSVTVTEETSQSTEPEKSSADDAAVSGKKKKRKKGPKAELQTDVVVAESQVSTEAVSTPLTKESTPETETTVSKKKKKSVKAEESPEEVQTESQVNGVSTEEDGAPTGPENPTDSTTPAKKKSKKKRNKKNLKADEDTEIEADAQVEVEEKHTDPDIPSVAEEESPNATTVLLKKKAKKKGTQEDTTLTASAAADESSVTPLKKKRKNNQKESKTAEEDEGAAAESTRVEDAEKLSMTTPTKKKKKKLAAAQVDESKDETQAQEVGCEDAADLQEETDVLSSSKKLKKKKRKIPVVFEFEADELEAASINGLMEEETAAKKTKLLNDAGEPSTPLSTKKSQKKAKTPAGSNFITFQSNAAVPTPLFCRTKGSPGTPLSSKKKSQTPKSESKKVTFGLKNNKTAEFRKTDRSLLVSPDGSSRVPFDPKQKPKFGVLKSPATPLSTRIKKTPTGPKKTGCSAAKSTPKRRPSAADFF